MLHDNTGAYTPDFAGEIDREEEVIADRYGISLDEAREILTARRQHIREGEAIILGRVIGLLLECDNLRVMVHALAVAAGLDQLNGAHSETEISKRLGVTRALLSHYVVGWRDLLSGKSYNFDVVKFRKNNRTRQIYADKAKSPLLAAKERYRLTIQRTKRHEHN